MIKGAFLKFMGRLSLFSIVICSIAIGIKSTESVSHVLPLFPLIFGHSFIVASLIHYFLIYSSNKSPQRFISYYMATVSIKLFLYLTFLILIVLLNRSEAMMIIIQVFVLYLAFTVFELFYILRFLRKKDEEKMK